MMFSIFVEDNDAIIGLLILCNNLFPFTLCTTVAASLCFLPVGKHLEPGTAKQILQLWEDYLKYL